MSDWSMVAPSPATMAARRRGTRLRDIGPANTAPDKLDEGIAEHGGAHHDLRGLRIGAEAELRRLPPRRMATVAWIGRQSMFWRGLCGGDRKDEPKDIKV